MKFHEIEIRRVDRSSEISCCVVSFKYRSESSIQNLGTLFIVHDSNCLRKPRIVERDFFSAKNCLLQVFHRSPFTYGLGSLCVELRYQLSKETSDRNHAVP